MPVRRDWGFTNHRLSDSWEVGLGRADRWSALDYARTNGIGSRIFCPAVRATEEARHQITGCSSRPFCIGSEPVFHGEIYRYASVIGRARISVLADGRRAVFSSAFSSCWRAMPTTNI